MAENQSSKGQATDESALAPVESLSEKAIRKELRSDAVQHPATVLPLGVGILSLIYLVLFSPIFGGSLGAIVVLIASALVAAGSFFWRYSIRYSDAYGRRVQELMELQDHQRTAAEQAELGELQETLRSGFSALNSAEGVKAVQELGHEYEELQTVAGRERGTDPLSIARISALAQETYRQGLGVLRHAFELMRAIDLPDKKRLQEEVSQLERELGSLRGKEGEAERVKIREDTLASHKERLDMMNEYQLRVEKLLYQSDQCEASLHRTRIELAAIKAESLEASVSTVTDTLQRAITQAKEVQEELRRLGF